MIAIGSDHGGYLLKEELKRHLEEKGIEFKDFGTDSAASCDYPVYAEKVCRAIQSGECEKGILICGTGIGMSMCANKCKGIRAALCGARLGNPLLFDALGQRTEALHGFRVAGKRLQESLWQIIHVFHLPVSMPVRRCFIQGRRAARA